MTRWTTLTAAAGTLAVLAVAFVTLGKADAWTLLTLPALTLLFLGLHFHGGWPAWARVGFEAFVTATGATFSVSTVDRMARNLSRLPQWDYLGFWLHARTAVLGFDFYDPVNARTLVIPYDVSRSFQEEIVDVGFWYPPPSMFVFWPLGLFSDAAAALPLWYAVNVLAVAISVFLLWRIFFASRGVTELLACAALVCALHGTYSTFRFCQTNFLALVAFLLYWRRRESWAGGIWVTAATFVKPFMAAVAIGPLLARRWRMVAAMAMSGIVLCLTAAAAFGPGSFVEYFARNQIGGKPDWIYSQPTNQSLLGLVLRLTDAECSEMGCVTNPLFLSGAALLGLATLALGIALQRAREDEWALSLFLLLALIVYPVSQLFYSVLLVPLVLLVWQRRHRLAGGPWSTSMLLATVFGLAALNRGQATVLAFLLLWAAMALIGLRLVRGSGWPLQRKGT